ncbi:hypothetical protein [Streptomyces nigrescens]|uniref:hypothetical protein n=1 Tax=Streptomyces nigrescens TaxID=1920 RepID=UPI0021C2E157|nr:hypothetical protein [Streptomyces nigrescens]
MAFALVGLKAACSREPSDKKLRAQATSSEAQSRRAAEEQRQTALIQRLAAVDGLEHVLTRFVDSCVRPYKRSVFENRSSPYLMTCSMRAVAYFGVHDDMANVLRRIREAHIATWGPQDGEGRDLPQAAGTVTYALSYHRARGRAPDGSPMPAPTLEATGLRIDWDRTTTPVPHRVADPTPCPPPEFGLYQHCSTISETPKSLAAARAHYGTLLSFTLSGSSASSTDNYFTVPAGSDHPAIAARMRPLICSIRSRIGRRPSPPVTSPVDVCGQPAAGRP